MFFVDKDNVLDFYFSLRGSNYITYNDLNIYIVYQDDDNTTLMGNDD